MKIAIVVGTRPEIIKMSPIIKECERRSVPFVLIHSNQHYSPEMDSLIFEDLNLPKPDYNLRVGTQQINGNQIGNILIQMEVVLKKEKPDVVLVQGDTNTVSAGALAASHLGIKLGHVEAGLRSYDRTMPEELNRVITDHLSDYLFAVSETQKNILLKEGINSRKIKAVGNTITDALFNNLKIAKEKSTIKTKLSLNEGEFILFTSHRSGNVDYKEPLREILNGLQGMNEISPQLKIVWPIHPRTLKKMKEFDYMVPDYVVLTDPLGYLDFITLMGAAKVIVTDSGGVQEEACILGVPCITIRENTERPETVDVGSNELVGRNLELWKASFRRAMDKTGNWENPFGDGNTASRILDTILYDLGAGYIVEDKNQKLSVVGMGYMGFPMACLLANAGYEVEGVDISVDRVEGINNGEVPFEENGIETIFTNARKRKFKATTQIKPSDIYLIAVPTPVVKERCDLKYVISAAESIAEVARNGNLVIVESTVSPGTCDEVISPIFKHKNIDVDIVFCPERAIPGQTLNELIHNNRIIGGNTKKAVQRAREVYASFVQGDIYETNSRTAECAKLMENAFRDVNIAFANEMHVVMDKLGVDVREAIRLANKHPRVNILNPGVGVGGHCIAVDPWFIAEKAPEESRIIKIARQINDEKPSYIAMRVHQLCKDSSVKKIGVLGLTYKPEVDDCRESPSIKLMEELRILDYEVKGFDPHVINHSDENTLSDLDDWADILVMATRHSAFGNIKTSKKIIDIV